MLRLALFAFLIGSSPLVNAGDEPSRQEPPRVQCGAGNSGSFASKSDGRNRVCGAAGKRNYVPRHNGIGFEILDSDSVACFVPDEEYRLLDEIVDAVLSETKYDPASPAPMEQAKRISRAVSEVLTKRGFALYIDTETLSDALINRHAAGEPERHIFDCDTGSLIFLTVAEVIGAPVALVEIPLSHSTYHHNYVRWLKSGAPMLEWDMNLKSECVTPAGLTGEDGKTMSREETLGYALSLRAKLWERQARYDLAVADYRAAMKQYHGSTVYNNLAWLVATRDMPQRNLLQKDALSAAEYAVSISPTANYLDTLACVYALKGDWLRAVKYETEAIAETTTPSYERRRKMFEKDHKDCTGE